MNFDCDLILNEIENSKSNDFSCITNKTKKPIVDMYRKNLMQRFGIAFNRFSQPQLTPDQLLNQDIPTGPEFKSITEQNHLINITGGDNTTLIIESFEDCFFDNILMKNMLHKNLKRPTLIQKCVFPIILIKQNYDLIARAETGSGKTAAFCLPIIQYLLHLKKKLLAPLRTYGPYAIIILPTRELTQQIGDNFRAFAQNLSLEIVTTYGETDFFNAKRAIISGCDILVSTPGRVIQFYRDEILNLQFLKFLVLDEADKLLQDQFIQDLTVFKDGLNEKNNTYRTLMFSATFDTWIEKLATRFLKPNFFKASVGSDNVVAKTVTQNFIQTKKHEKIEVLYKELMKSFRGTFCDEKGLTWKHVEKTLVFCNTRRKCNWIALHLSLSGIKANCTHGDRTQRQRQEAKESFEKGDCDVLVSTNVLARGLNIVGIEHIIIFELPKEREDYIHRIGRTGRAGNTGRSTAFVDPEDNDNSRLAPYLIYHLQLVNQHIPDFLISIADKALN